MFQQLKYTLSNNKSYVVVFISQTKKYGRVYSDEICEKSEYEKILKEFEAPAQFFLHVLCSASSDLNEALLFSHMVVVEMRICDVMTALKKLLFNCCLGSISLDVILSC